LLQRVICLKKKDLKLPGKEKNIIFEEFYERHTIFSSTFLSGLDVFSVDKSKINCHVHVLCLSGKSLSK
jgi:hypothetical protein